MSHYLRAEATRRLDEEPPGWVEVRFREADGTTAILVEKAPVLDAGERLGAGAEFPVTIAIPCDVLEESTNGAVHVRLWFDIEDQRGRGVFRVPAEAVFSLEDAVREATRRAVTELFASYPDHRFYYLTLTTPGEVLTPYLSASSYETSTDEELKWSYADSAFMFFGERHFAELRPLFEAGGDPEARLAAIERAVRTLDEEGLFSAAPLAREDMIVTVEVMPPDHTNTARTIRLNPPGPALTAWLTEAAE
ncbi:DUF4303 domain-containing protein [Actinoplanes derwentensis]|uniref:Uncharacterized protein n=1 Tax=Actinoplanes derwentensis TaxID=113562 RepID=A0A1H1WTJ8_9ACTN|nr:DUF4303 domain-containing protein [Actinoplanes derwentensis]GID86976.1 hypothetical protein Ade03nite_59000 [Actinoplanes derwentensis]SDT00503.1 protein of unknown function [Actinoplanes derwentensis]